MSSVPVSYIAAPDLAKALKQQNTSGKKTIAVVDVRDDDFEGGNIKGCTHIPSTDFPSQVDELATATLRDMAQVVFHCSLSQSRGPKAARMYAEARQKGLQDGTIKDHEQQKVQVLRDGFSNFGQQYRDDPDIVEKYDEESWAYR